MTDERIKRTNYIVLILFGGSVLLRFLLGSYYPRTINCYPDELLYLSSASSLWNQHQVLIQNMPSTFEKIGYSLLIAPAFAFQSIKLRGAIIALINALLVSLGIFPVYGLARRMLTEQKHCMFCVVLYAIFPSLTYSMTYMSEVVYLPLALCTIYVVYRFFEETVTKKRVVFAVIFAMLIVIDYTVKSVALGLLVAFLLEVLKELLQSQKRRNQWMGFLILILGVIGSVAVLRSGMIEWDMQVMGDKALYVIFGIVFFVLITILAFCVLPVLLPAICYQDLEHNARTFYRYLLWTVFITAVITASMIYTTEDYPSLMPRAHVRYVEYAFVPFVILIMQLLEHQEREISRRRMVGVFSIWVVAFLMVYRGYSGQTMDQTMLFYWQLFADEGKYFVPWKVRILSGVVVLVVVALAMLYRRKNKLFERILTIGLIVMCLGNSAISCYIQYRTHTHTKEEAVEAEKLLQFVREHPKEQFLVLESRQQDEMIDTFLLDCTNVRTGLGPVPTQEEGTYRAPQDVSYVITDVTAEDIMMEGTVVSEYPALGFILYKGEMK